MSVTSLVYDDGEITLLSTADPFGDGSGLAWYKFNGNSNDEAGNYNGTEGTVAYGGGVYGRGVSFSGVTGSNIAIPLVATSISAISIWIYVRASGTAAYVLGSQTAVQAQASIKLGTDGVDVWINNKEASKTMTTSVGWHHLVATGNGSVMTVYLDGSLVSGTSTATLSSASTSLAFGRYRSDTGFGTQAIDNVRIFNRNLTALEALALYNEALPASILDSTNPFEDSSLKAKFQFNSSPSDLLNVYNGTETAGCSYVAGKYGNSLLITNGKFAYGGTSKNLMPSTGNYSVSCWMKKVAGQRNVIASRYNSSAYGETFFMESTGAFIYGTPSAVTTASNSTSPTQTILDDGNFHHAALVVNRTTLKSYVYIDGYLFYTGASLASPYDNNLGTVSGAFHTTNYYGNFDQMQFYNKALTPTEVVALYTETTPLEEPMNAQVDPFKDGSGKSLYRFDGNALDESGNYVGTPTSVTYASSSLGGRGVVFSNPRTASVPTSYVRLVVGTLTDFTYTFWLTKSVTGSHGVAGKFVSPWTNFISISTTMSFGVNSLSYSSTVSFTDDTNMHFYSVSRQGTTLKFYRDGVYLDSKTVSTAASDIDVIGCYLNASSATSTTGTVDQFRKFNRVLTDAEITQLYNAGA